MNDSGMNHPPLRGEELATARLRMVPLGPDLIEEMARLHADPRVMATMKDGVETRDQTLRRLQAYEAAWRANGFGMWGLFEAATGAFIGECGLVDRREEGVGIALRFALFPEIQGRGFAGEAVGAVLAFADAAGLGRIAAMARASNAGSRRVLERAGLILEEEWESEGTRVVRYARPAPILSGERSSPASGDAS